MTYFPSSRNPLLPKAEMHRFGCGSKVKKGSARDIPSLAPYLDTRKWKWAGEFGAGGKVGVTVNPSPSLVLRPEGQLALASP